MNRKPSGNKRKPQTRYANPPRKKRRSQPKKQKNPEVNPDTDVQTEEEPQQTSKSDKIEVEGTVVEPLPNAMFRVELDNKTPDSCPHLRQNAEVFYQNFAR